MLENFISPLIFAAICTHITVLSVTIFLHRGMAHSALKFSPELSHFFRFWLWLTTGVVTKQWVAVHRKHHTFCEKQDDPHSPHIHGIWKVLFLGILLYKKEADNQETLARYGKMCPDDWLENNIYRHNSIGLLILLVINLSLFGFYGILSYIIQIIWIPLTAAGIINGIGHYLGYRNFFTSDKSRNISPLGLIIGGEELHNNHHAYPTSAKLSFKLCEFDLGFGYIKIFEFLNLLKINKLSIIPNKQFNNSAIVIKMDSNLTHNINDNFLSVFLNHKCYLMQEFKVKVKKQVGNEIKVFKKEFNLKLRIGKIKSIFYDSHGDISIKDKILLKHLLEFSPALKTIYKFKENLLAMWDSKAVTREELKVKFIKFFEEFKNTNIAALDIFLHNTCKISVK